MGRACTKYPPFKVVGIMRDSLLGIRMLIMEIIIKHM